MPSFCKSHMYVYVSMHGNQLSGFQVGWFSTMAGDKAAGTDAITFVGQ